MRTAGRRRTIKLAMLLAAITALAIVPTADALTSDGKTVKLSINCSGTPGGPGGQGIYGAPSGTVGASASGCSGKVTLTAKVKRKKRTTVGSAGFSLTSGQKTTVSVKLSRKARKRLRLRRKLKVTVQVATASAVSSPATLTIRLKKRKK